MTQRQLTGHESQLIADRINAKVGEGALVCPVSGPGDWDVLERISFVPASPPSHWVGVRSPHIYPSATIVCKDCGYTMLFNLFRLGVAEDLGFYHSPEIHPVR